VGIDKSLSDRYPSVIINGQKYHYGREPKHGQYLVENASYAKDNWCFDEKEDLQAFLINLPDSANHRARIAAAYPDWHEVTHEQRGAYLEEDRANQRLLAEGTVKSGTAPSFDMDLEGEHGPHEPQRIESRSKEPPIDRVERQIAAYQAVEAVNAKRAGYPIASGEWPLGYSDTLKLLVLEGKMDWTGVIAKDKEAVLAREVDFAKITPEQFRFVYKNIAENKMEPADPAVAQALFDRSRAQPGPTPIRHTTRNLIEAIWLDAWPRAGAIVDFGIDTQKHYEALFYGVREGEITPEALDAALGKGEKLTALARSARSNPHRDIRFTTSWDGLRDRPDAPESTGRESGRGFDEEPMLTGKEAEALHAEIRSGEATKPLPSPSEIVEGNRDTAATEKGQHQEKDRGRK